MGKHYTLWDILTLPSCLSGTGNQMPFKDWQGGIITIEKVAL